MNMEILFYVGAGLVALLAVGFIVTRLYVRATKELAFVRTGFGNEKVVLNGGALVFPVLHEAMRVGMNTTSLEVKRENEDSLITKDSMLVNVHAQFFVRVSPTIEAISRAAQTLGRRTLEPGQLKSFIEGKFVDALRNVAARMTLDDLNENRQEFVRAVQEACAHDLGSNGLELETVSLTSLVQTDKKYFNPENALHAQGLTELTKRTSERAKVRNEIETETRVQIETKNLETNKQSFAIAQEAEFARLQQEAAVKNRAAEQAAEVAGIEAKRTADIAAANARGQQEAEQAQIAAAQVTQTKKVEADRELQVAQQLARQQTQTKTIEAEREIQLAQQARNIAVAEASRKQSAAQAEADLARADAVKAQQAVTTAEETAVAERAKAVQLIEATQRAEQQAIGVRVQAQAERDAAAARAEAARVQAEGEASALRATAEGEAEAAKLRAEAQRVTYQVEAEGKRSVLEAGNIQSPESMAFQNRAKLLEQLPAIVRESVKPLERIDSIKVVDVRGLGTGGGLPGDVHGGGAGTSMADSVTNAALRHRVQAPLIDGLLEEVGLTGGIEDLAANLRGPNPTGAAKPKG